MNLTDFNTVRPVTNKDYRQGYIQLPAFSYTYDADDNVSEQAYQINYTTDRAFVITNLPSAPESVNFIPVIRYRRGDVIYRYALWSTGEERLADTVRLYNGEVIYPQFSIEIWTIPGGTEVSLEDDTNISVSHRKLVENWGTDGDYEVTTVKNEHDRSELTVQRTTSLPEYEYALNRCQLLPGTDNLVTTVWQDSSGSDNDLAGTGAVLSPEASLAFIPWSFVAANTYQAVIDDVVNALYDNFQAAVILIKPTSYPAGGATVLTIDYGSYSVMAALKQKDEADASTEPKYKLEIGSTSAEIELATGDWSLLYIGFDPGFNTGFIKVYDPAGQDLLDSDTFSGAGLNSTTNLLSSLRIYQGNWKIGFASVLTNLAVSPDTLADSFAQLQQYISVNLFGAILPISFTPTDAFNWNDNV